jgi:hypothetical protein
MSLGSGNGGKSREVSLSSKGLMRTKIVDSDKFTFVVGEQECVCNDFEALFISPAVERLRLSDMSVNRFDLSVSGSGYGVGCECVKYLEDLMSGQSIEVGDNNVSLLISLASSLENDELLSSLFRFEEPICKSNVIFRFHQKIGMKVDVSEEISFIASHFHEFNSSDLRELSYEVLDVILSDDHLRLLDEDSLVSVVSELGREYFGLFRHIEFLFLSVGGVEHLLSLISVDDLNSELWSSLCRRLVRPIDLSDISIGDRFVKDSAAMMKIESEKFRYVSGSEFNGIFAHLRTECGSNVHKKGIVSITSSGDCCNHCWQV